MKKLSGKLIAMSIMASLLLLYSCGDDDTEDPAPELPAAPSASISGALSSVGTFEVGDSVAIQVSYQAPGEISGFNFQVFVNKDSADEQSSTKNFNSPTDVGLTEADLTSGAFNFIIYDEIPSDLSGKRITVVMEIVDKEDQADSLGFAFNVVTGIDAFTTVLIGGFNNNSLGSSYDSRADSVYFGSDLRSTTANQAKIDFIYYFADTPQRTIASPDSEAAQTTWAAQNPGAAWPFGVTENSTRFKAVAAGFDFDAAETQTALSNAYGEVGDELIRVTQLAVNDVYAFKLDDSREGKFGLLKVTAVDGNSSGSITISVKIQK